MWGSPPPRCRAAFNPFCITETSGQVGSRELAWFCKPCSSLTGRNHRRVRLCPHRSLSPSHPKGHSGAMQSPAMGKCPHHFTLLKAIVKGTHEHAPSKQPPVAGWNPPSFSRQLDHNPTFPQHFPLG